MGGRSTFPENITSTLVINFLYFPKVFLNKSKRVRLHPDVGFMYWERSKDIAMVKVRELDLTVKKTRDAHLNQNTLYCVMNF